MRILLETTETPIAIGHGEQIASEIPGRLE